MRLLGFFMISYGSVALFMYGMYRLMLGVAELFGKENE